MIIQHNSHVCLFLTTVSVFQIPFYAFEQALVLHDRARFVDLFLQQRFAIHEHLTPLKYLRLFQRASQEPFFAENVWTHILGHPFSKTENTPSFS